MKRMLKALRHTSGTFWAELIPTIFYCAFLSLFWRQISEVWDVMDTPLAILALLYPAKVLLMAWLRSKGGDSWDYGHSRTLVTTGPYSITRNPVYALAMAQFIAWLFCVIAVMIQDDVWTDPTAHPMLWMLGAAAALGWFWHYACAFAIPREEKRLAADHPVEFPDYCRRVGR